MSRLEDLQPNANVRGILPDSQVTVVHVEWHGTDVVELTYKTPAGGTGNELLYRDREADIEVVEQGLRSPRENSWALDPELLQQQVNQIQLSTVLDTAILGACARKDKEAMRQLDELAEQLGLRVTIGADGNLTVQFGVPFGPSMGGPSSEASESQMVSRPYR